MRLVPANDDGMRDYTQALLFLCPHLIGEGCQVVLDARQFEVLKRYLQHIQSLGSRVNFQLEMCVDHRSGYSVSWDNDGNAFQDDAVDTIMEGMVQNLGFYAGSILREGHLIELCDIDAHVDEILTRVRSRHGLS